MSTAKIIELNETNTCKLYGIYLTNKPNNYRLCHLCFSCDNALAKYFCPRCNIPYCSLDCYRSEKHGQCSETFYKDCVTQELVLDEPDERARERMLEILQKNRFDEETIDSDDEEETLDLGERLAGIDLNDADKVWEKLTHDEQQEFMAFLKSEDVAKYVPKWEAWWMFETEKKVQEIEESGKYKENCPEIMGNIKDFKAISVCFFF